ncbi:MAG TPA: aminotransferase class V-fold PLP-dependent enzyme [Vicinamibacterales bacterium]|nr:aminotransferase class V-fold PLP-dependent enzyme [Vicinamibacterales bacterium]
MSHAQVLRTAAEIAIRYLDEVGTRHVGGRANRTDLAAALGGPLPEGQLDPVSVIRDLSAAADPGLVATPGPRFFGFVTGGALPVSVAAEWLTSAYDQNGALYVMSPAVAVMEDVVSAWLLDLLHLPAASSVGFVTGAHMANFTCLAAARHEVLRRVGWNIEDDGFQAAPRLTVIVGDEVHISVVGAARMLGIGAGELVRVPVDGQGRMRLDAFEEKLAGTSGPVIICTQAGNVNTGGSDPVGAIAAAAHRRQAWVHVDGAFGLWAAAVPGLQEQVAGLADADSWTTDAHKWLNVPYDSGLAIVAHPAPHRAAMSLHASYLMRGAEEERIGMDWVPESSRRARVIPIYALLRTLGRSGVQAMIVRNCAFAQRIADHLRGVPGVRVLNEVVLNQVLLSFGSDAVTRDVIARVQADGTCWVGGATWRGQQVMRISISNWSTTEDDVDRSAAAIRRAFTDASG